MSGKKRAKSACVSWGRGYSKLPREMCDELLKWKPHLRFPVIDIWRRCRHAPGVARDPETGVRYELDAGEMILGINSFAERHGLSRDAVRALRKRLIRLGWTSEHPASNRTIPSTTGSTTGSTIPPTIVRFEKWREILCPDLGSTIPSPIPSTIPSTTKVQIQQPDTLHGHAPAIVAPPIAWPRPAGGERPRPAWAVELPPLGPDAPGPRQMGLELLPPDTDVQGIRRWIEERRKAAETRTAPATGAGEAGGEPW